MAYYGGVTTERPWPRIDGKVIAIAVAIIGGLGVLISSAALYFNSSSKTSYGPNVIVMKPVLVASDDIQAGERLNPSLFQLETRPVESDATNLIGDTDSIIGRFAAAPVRRGSIITVSDLSETSVPGGRITQVIPEGFRAVTIPVDPLSGVEGWAVPGARVDVVWSSEHRGRPIVTTIVENAKVISAERSTETANSSNQAKAMSNVPKFVTLLVTIKDAQKIQLGRGSGTLSLNLRGDGDRELSGHETLTMENLLRSAELLDENEVKGKVSVNGKNYVLKGGSLVSAQKESN